MPDINHLIRISAKPAIVFNALTTQAGLQSWWTPKVDLGPSSIDFHFEEGYHKTMKVEASREEEHVEWYCTEGHPEWIGTSITMDLEKSDDSTLVFFSHYNWLRCTEMFGQCSYQWAMFLKSLKSYCESGKGQPFPDQEK